MSSRAHLFLRLAALAVIVAAATYPRGGAASTADGQRLASGPTSVQAAQVAHR